MTDMHGIVFAFHSFPELGALQLPRTAASLPFCGRYRLIDFSLSAMTNAGVRDVGVIVQRDYRSLLDHMRGGKDWDLSRRDGGYRMLPPFGMPNSHLGEYKGCMEALSAVTDYLEDIRQKYVVITRGDLIAGLDLAEVYESHVRSGCEITAVCTGTVPSGSHHRYILDGEGRAVDILCCQTGDTGGVTSLEVYIINKDTLLKLVSTCSAHRQPHLHRDALKGYLQNGGVMNVYMFSGYSRHVTSVQEYYRVNMDMLRRGPRDDVFSPERPVRTREHSDTSTYYADKASVHNCLIADGCTIDGDLENCVVFAGCHIGEGVRLRNCIVMQNTVVNKDARMSYVIADKDVVITEGTNLAGCPDLPLIIPKGTKL